MKTRSWTRVIAVAVLALAPALACAQAWPSKAVKIIVPFAAGGTTDVLGRVLANKLGPALGTTVVVDN